MIADAFFAGVVIGFLSGAVMVAALVAIGLTIRTPE